MYPTFLIDFKDESQNCSAYNLAFFCLTGESNIFDAGIGPHTFQKNEWKKEQHAYILQIDERCSFLM